MPVSVPRLNVAARAVLLLMVFLGVWWTLGRPAARWSLAAGFRAYSALAGANAPKLTSTDVNTEWSFVVPYDVVVPNPNGTGPVHLGLFTVYFPISVVDVFTFSLPAYCALALAVPGWRRARRARLLGFACCAVLEWVLLIANVWLSLFAQLAQWVPPGPTVVWLRLLGEYFCCGVLPYAAPLFLALACDPALRAYLLNLVWVDAPSATAAIAPTPDGLSPRQRRRARRSARVGGEA